MAFKQIDNLGIEGAKIIFRNFIGEKGKFNNAGERSFNVIIEDPEMAQKLLDDGWNVKTREPRDEDESPMYHVNVMVRFDRKPPKIIMIANGVKTFLDEESVAALQYAEIINADVVINGSYWEVNGKSGVKAYLKAAYITIEVDEFAAKYADEEAPEECPF